MNSVSLSAFFDATSGFRWVITEARRFPDVSVVKNLPANEGDTGMIPGLGRSSEGGNGNPLQYSCLENPMNRGA